MPHLLLAFLLGNLQETSYPYHSIEGQMRALADLAFLLGQYEFAVQSYRLAAQDYLAAPNSKWYAGAEVRLAVLSLALQLAGCSCVAITVLLIVHTTHPAKISICQVQFTSVILMPHVACRR
jgi:hypothetical protein